MLTNICIEVVLEMLFLVLSNTNFQFGAKKLKFYTVADALCTISWVKLISKRKFAKAALNEN